MSVKKVIRINARIQLADSTAAMAVVQSYIVGWEGGLLNCLYIYYIQGSASAIPPSVGQWQKCLLSDCMSPNKWVPVAGSVLLVWIVFDEHALCLFSQYLNDKQASSTPTHTIDWHSRHWELSQKQGIESTQQTLEV